MRLLTALLMIAPFGLGGCSYVPTAADPIRYITSPAEVSACRRLTSVGLARTDGESQFELLELTGAAPGQNLPYTYGPPLAGREIVGPNFAARLNVMRDAAISLGATDLLLTRRIYRDWSYVEGIAYVCRR